MFTKCNSTSYEHPDAIHSYNGGAVFVNGIKELAVSSSSFVRCCAPQTNHDNSGSGGIFATDVLTSLAVSNCDFLFCFTGASGGGTDIQSLKTSSVRGHAMDSCRFISCTGYGNSPDGGCICFWTCVYPTGCASCLFAHNYAAFQGGALYFRSASPTSNSRVYPFLSFCFFSDNLSQRGNDAAFEGYVPSEPFLHCFSTSSLGRIYNGNDNWLPITTYNPLLCVYDALT